MQIRALSVVTVNHAVHFMLSRWQGWRKSILFLAIKYFEFHLVQNKRLENRHMKKQIMITGPATKITNLGALKIVLGVKHFVIYIAYIMVFSLVTGFLINLFL